MSNKIIVALDGMDMADSLSLAKKLAGHVWGFKVNDLLVREGNVVVEVLKNFGNVFADPKFFDIPNTVANGVKALAKADFITVHALAGAEVLKAAKKACKNNTKILAVTVLTSDNQENRVYEVRKRAYVAQNAGVDGIICAAADLEDLKDIPLLKVVPGIRPAGAVKNEDQVHISSTIPLLADYVVLGRALTQAEDPIAVLSSLN